MAIQAPALSDEEPYDSASDEDFNPTAQPADEELSSSSDDNETPAAGPAKKPKKGTKRARVVDAVDAEWDSGDEATIQERRKRKKRKGGDAAAEALSEDEGGEGGFIRTRAQRRTDKVERKVLVSTAGSTLDVEAVWKRLAALPIGRPVAGKHADGDEEGDYVMIKRSTRFAGMVTTEERRVLRSSKEAKIWLEEQEVLRKKEEGQKAKHVEPEILPETTDTNPALPLRRPLKRIFKFETNPLGEVKGLPANLQLRWPRDKLAPVVMGPPKSGIVNHRKLPELPKAAKLNTVQKSRYDWASHVDEAQLGEELDRHGKSKDSYAMRTQFLDQVEKRREEGLREGRGGGG